MRNPLETLRYLATTNEPGARFYSFQRVVSLNYNAAAGGCWGWVLLPNGRSIAWNLPAETGETEVARWGIFGYYRPETPQEERDRLEGEEEAAYEAWCADFYSY